MEKEFTYSLEEMKSTMTGKKTGVLARESTGNLIISLSIANSSYPVSFYSEEKLIIKGEGVAWTIARKLLCRHIVKVDDLLPEQDFSYFYIISLIATGCWADQEQVKWMLLTELLKVRHIHEALEKEFPTYFARRNEINYTSYPICVIYPEEDHHITIYESTEDSEKFSYSGNSDEWGKTKEVLTKAMKFIDDKIEEINLKLR